MLYKIKLLANRVYSTYFFKKNSVLLESSPIVLGSFPQIDNHGLLYIAKNVTFRTLRFRQRLRVYKDANLHIGENIFLNDGVNICATTSITIGANTKIGDLTYIYDSDFHQISPDKPVRRLAVSIGSNVWIGANCMVLAGSTIGNNTVIAAGSIVNSDLPADCLAAGSPARVIRYLDIPPGWIRQ